jgi:hypothetical protein
MKIKNISILFIAVSFYNGLCAAAKRSKGIAFTWNIATDIVAVSGMLGADCLFYSDKY